MYNIDETSKCILLMLNQYLINQNTDNWICEKYNLCIHTKSVAHLCVYTRTLIPHTLRLKEVPTG